MMQGVSAYMGFMCIMETYKIYTLLKEGQLHQHPLFESARSPVRAVVDSAGVSQRLNDSAHDDEDRGTPVAPPVVHTELRPFGGAGRSLGSAQPAQERSQQSSKWLDRLEKSANHKNKTVQQLEDERQ